MDASDEELLQRVARGDRTALRAFYLRHEHALFNFLRSILQNDAGAYEVVNEAMFEVWRKADAFQGRSRPGTWLFSIARNRAIDRLRASRRSETVELDVEIADDGTPRPEDVIAAAQSATHLEHCLGRIPAAQREVVHLAFFEDMSFAEIGGLLGLPEGTVKSRMFHAKQALRHCLDGLTRRR